MDNPREQRGLAIAATKNIKPCGHGLWIVPSQSSGQKYTVRPDKTEPFCSCPDHENGFKCKHIFAVEFTLTRISEEQNVDGSVTTTTETVTVKTTAERKTYKQDWPKYNAAQTGEHETFPKLLADLCSTIKQPEPKGGKKGGRPTLLLSDAVFCACLKVYSMMSARRFSGDMDEAVTSGHIQKKPHFNSVLNVFDREDVTPILKELVRVSALPLATVETKIAIDSSGFSSSKFDRWFDEKHGKPRSECIWVKAHIAAGCRTNVITAAQVLESHTGDHPQFTPLAKETSIGFPKLDYAADMAYTSTETFTTVESLGGTLYAPFKWNATGAAGGIFEKMFHLFKLNHDEYMQKYHPRSNVESTFSAVKRKFGDSVKSRNPVSMKNEVYAKFVCHNVCCLIAETFALGINPTFGKNGCTQTAMAAQIPGQN